MKQKIIGLNRAPSAIQMPPKTKSTNKDNIELFTKNCEKGNVDKSDIFSKLNEDEKQVSKENDNKKNWLIGTCVALGTIAIGVGGYLLLKKTNTSLLKQTKNITSNTDDICALVSNSDDKLTSQLCSIADKSEHIKVSTSTLQKLGINLKSYPPNIQSKIDDFFAILESRNGTQIPDDKISEILKGILENPAYKSEKDLEKYLDYLKKFASRKAPNGKPLLSAQNCKFLADFKGNGLTKEQFQDFADLVHCAEKGLVPPDALVKFNIAAGVNPQILRDIEKLKLAAAKGVNPIDVFIPQFESAIKNADEISKLKPGDFFSVIRGANGQPGVYLVKENSISLVNVDRETLFSIMPPVKRFYIGQQQSGTCYQLASYISMLDEPNVMSKILQRLKRTNDGLMIKMPRGSTPNNMFAGLFDDFSAEGSVKALLDSEGRFIVKDRSQSVKSNPLIKALECLYGKHRKYTIADEYVRAIESTSGKQKAKEAFEYVKANINRCVFEKDSKGNFIVKTLDEINEANKLAIQRGNNKAKIFQTVEDFYKESGSSDEVFRFLGDKFNMVDYLKTAGKKDSATLNEMRRRLTRNKATFVFGTMPKQAGRESLISRELDLYSSHAYSIVDYDSKTDIVTYINPWNSAMTFKAKLSSLAEHINTMSTVI